MIKVGIFGYGNLGKGVECAIAKNKDMELVGVFTRRDPASVKVATEGVNVYHEDALKDMKDQQISDSGNIIQEGKYEVYDNIIKLSGA